MIHFPVRRKINIDNAPSAEVIAGLVLICNYILEPVREWLGISLLQKRCNCMSLLTIRGSNTRHGLIK
ncbi:hypothetical protein SAMN05428978_101179 [Nitrosomonas sp. Nm34]|nr:hypothetical protein SAMN05428978_101179 [Nitrosomonas sp. Nm34]